MLSNDRDTAGVIARPPLLFLGGLLGGAVLDRLMPLGVTPPGAVEGYRLAGGLTVAGGVALVAAGIRNFTRAATPIPTSSPTTTLVQTGVHGWTRNPIYLGMFLIYGGVTVATRSPWSLVLALPIAVTMRYGVVAREEAYLDRRFGATYRNYQARVRRWL
ncbi:MAG TPA: isoprenylcysteine carboxylmethyltransferase family protein [Vicinamibacterales bacterium]|nr:isoprenylcysteine carboxylmethyltransferase family protein [Vicinamibacterales bacterium]